MNDLEKLKELAAIDAAKVHAAFNRLEEDVKGIIDGLAFRLKQALHSTTHETVDSQSATAAGKITDALNTAREAATGDSAVGDGSESIAAGSAPTVEVKTTDETSTSTVREDVAAIREKFADADKQQAAAAASDGEKEPQ